MSGKEIFLQKNNSKLTVSWESRLLRNILVCQTLLQKLLKILQLVWVSCCTLNVKILKAHDLFPWPGALRNWWGRIWLTQKRAMAICPQDMLQVKQGVPYLSTRSCHKWWAKCLAAVVACSAHELWCHCRRTPLWKRNQHSQSNSFGAICLAIK